MFTINYTLLIILHICSNVKLACLSIQAVALPPLCFARVNKIYFVQKNVVSLTIVIKYHIVYY